MLFIVPAVPSGAAPHARHGPAPYSCEYVSEMFSFFFFAANISDEMSSDALEQKGVTMNDT